MKFFDKFLANFNLMRGTKLLKKASNTDKQKAAWLREAAFGRFAVALARNPKLAMVHTNWGHGLYNASRKLSGKDRQRGFREACEHYQNAHEIDPNDVDTLKHWGLALRELAHSKREKQTDQLYEEAYKKFSLAANTGSDEHDVYYHWGLTLYQQAQKTPPDQMRSLYNAAIEKFSQDHDMSRTRPQTLNDWGASLMALAKLNDTDNTEQLMADALDKFQRADELKAGFASYNLACISSLMGEFDACREHLNTAKENGKLPGIGHLQRDDDLRAARKTDWFKSFIAELD